MPVTATRGGIFFGRSLGVAACLAVAVGCSKPTAKSRGSAIASPSSNTPVDSSAAQGAAAAASAPPNNILFRHTPVSADSIKTPPLTAPADALRGPNGVQYQILQNGTGDHPGPLDTVMVDINMWTKDGKLALSTYTDQQAAPFSVASLAPQLRGMLTMLRVGGRARFYLPRAAMAGWRPERWPDDDLIIELELLHASHVQSITDLSGNAVDPVASQPPDSGGPPSTAETSPSGIRYIFLERGTGSKHPSATDRIDLRLDVFAVEGLVVTPLERGFKSATTLESAPAKLGEVLSQMDSGDRVRVWLPANAAKQVIPKAGDHPIVMNMSATY